jgi:HD-GYP domain-containing protein (c-di-GMP phosphodiesterase class II)
MTDVLARLMGMDGEDLVNIRRGSLLHDNGKVGVPDAILRKPGRLTEDEWLEMRKHPQYAVDMLWPVEYLRPALAIPASHHEKWDGSGYPKGLKGEEIPFPARLFAIVDVWDALRSDRVYRPAMSEQEALKIIRDGRGTHFDPHVVDVFLEHLDEITRFAPIAESSFEHA